jgi:hypothetical protein
MLKAQKKSALAIVDNFLLHRGVIVWSELDIPVTLLLQGSRQHRGVFV